MKQIQNFFIEADLTQDRVMIRDKALLNQMQNVLRFRAGDKVVLLDKKGLRAEATVELIHHKEAELSIQNRERFSAPARLLKLFVAVPKKPATLEWIVEKATELGVSDIYPLDTARCQVHELRKTERLELIIKEASEQCERIFMPTLHPIQSLEDFLKQVPEGLALAGDPWTYDQSLKEIPTDGKDISIVIGPEGGLSADELAALRNAGVTLFKLGDLVLRMETAVVAALSVVQFG